MSEGSHERHADVVPSADGITHWTRQAVEASTKSSHWSEVAIVSLH